jgi:hypothetical protein
VKLICCLFLLTIALTRPVQADDPASTSPKTEPEKITADYLTFPSIVLPDAALMFAISRQETGFSVTIDASEQFLKHNKISARVHYPSDGNCPPAAGSPGGVALAGSFGGSWSWFTDFPFGKNLLQEAWVQLSIGSRQIWLEIPYGCFTRDPHAPPPPASPDGDARFPRAMKNLLHAKTTVQCGPKYFPELPERNLKARDIILHWTSIHYDSFPIQNGWSLTFIEDNLVEEPGSHVELYRETPHYPAWELHSPRTALHIVEDDVTIQSGRCMNIRLHNDNFRRTDTYSMSSTHARDESRRCWGEIEFGVDEKNYSLGVPSSLYLRDHGTTSSDAKTW